MNKQNVGYPYNDTLLGHHKEWSTDMRSNMDKPWKHYVKLNKPDAKGEILYDSTYIEHLE